MWSSTRMRNPYSAAWKGSWRHEIGQFESISYLPRGSSRPRIGVAVERGRQAANTQHLYLEIASVKTGDSNAPQTHERCHQFLEMYPVRSPTPFGYT